MEETPTVHPSVVCLHVSTTLTLGSFDGHDWTSFCEAALNERRTKAWQQKAGCKTRDRAWKYGSLFGWIIRYRYRGLGEMFTVMHCLQERGRGASPSGQVPSWGTVSGQLVSDRLLCSLSAAAEQDKAFAQPLSLPPIWISPPRLTPTHIPTANPQIKRARAAETCNLKIYDSACQQALFGFG